MFWINILIGLTAGAFTLLILSFLKGLNLIVIRVLAIIVTLVFIELSNIYFLPHFIIWKTIHQFEQIPFYHTIERTDPILFDEFIAKIEANILAKGSDLDVIQYSSDLDKKILQKYMGRASDEAIYSYLQANVNIYEALNDKDPNIIEKLQMSIQPDSNEMKIIKSVDSKLFDSLLESTNQIVLSAIIDPQPPSDLTDAQNRESKIIDQLSNKYNKKMVNQVFSNMQSLNMNHGLMASIVIDMYKALLNSGNNNAGIIMRAVYGNTINNSQLSGDDHFSSTAQEIYIKVSNSVFTVYSEKTRNAKYGILGTGVAISRNILVTNCHVALSRKYLVVRVEHGLSLASLYFQNGDICLIKVSDANFIPVSIRPSKEVSIGENVFAIGNPEGLERTISSGIISNKYPSPDGKLVILQTDAAISQGSSGGGLFDVKGNLIGITTAISRSGSNIGFVIPTELITDRDILKNLYNEKKFEKKTKKK